VQAFDVLSSMIQVSPSETNKFSCDNYAAIVSNADLLYKWLTVRMLDNNVQSTNSLVTFLVSLMDMLRHNGYTMTDGEASILLPSLVERVRGPLFSALQTFARDNSLNVWCAIAQLGNQKQRFRDGYRLAMRLVCFVYPASKSVAYLLHGLQSKNVRSRAECLDELAHIVSETGYRTVGRKGLQKIAALIATGEKDVRDTAIDVIEAVWMQVVPAFVALRPAEWTGCNLWLCV
jgi:cytoskeleton-associated protein 5